MTYTRALTYRDRDCLATIPLPAGSKEPAPGFPLRRWLNRKALPAEHHLSYLFRGDQNIAGIMGPPSLNALALDCDTPASFGDVGRRLAALGVVTRTIRRPANGTDHDGGGTYLFRAPVAVKTARRGDMEVRGRGSYILLPDSLHPGGGVYYDNGVVIFELPDLRALDWLELEPAPDTLDPPKSAWPLLKGNQETIARYASRSEAEYALCCMLANAGFSFYQAHNLFCKWTGPGKFREKLNTDGDDEARRYLALTWHNAADFVTAHPSEHKVLAQRLYQWAQGRAWPGRTGATDRAVYLAHLAIVQRCAAQPHGASVRELGELAGVNWKTAARANHRLVDAKLLELAELATVTCPHRWRLVEPKGTKSHTPPQSYLIRECVTWSLSGHDLGRWRGLNKGALEVVAALSRCKDQTATVTELAEMTGRACKTVRRKLNGRKRDNGDVDPGLFQLGIVEPVDRATWRLVPEFDAAMLDGAAEQLGVAGLGDRQRHRHLQDRVRHKIELERGRRD